VSTIFIGYRIISNNVIIIFSVIGGDFCSLWIGSIEDAISILDLKGIDNKIINIRFLWFQALFHLQDKEIGLTCGLLNMVTFSLLTIIFD